MPLRSREYIAVVGQMTLVFSLQEHAAEEVWAPCILRCSADQKSNLLTSIAEHFNGVLQGGAKYSEELKAAHRVAALRLDVVEVGRHRATN